MRACTQLCSELASDADGLRLGLCSLSRQLAMRAAARSPRGRRGEGADPPDTWASAERTAARIASSSEMHHGARATCLSFLWGGGIDVWYGIPKCGNGIGMVLMLSRSFACAGC
eukprot:189713-Prymnesium_polylepis.1